MSTSNRKQEIQKLIGVLGVSIRSLETVLTWNDNAFHPAEYLSSKEMDNRVMREVFRVKQEVDRMLTSYPEARKEDETSDDIQRAKFIERLKHMNPEMVIKLTGKQ